MKSFSRRVPALATLFLVAAFAATACQPQSAPPAATTAPVAAKETAPAPAAAVPGPVEGTRITEAYVRMVARDAYFWAWPLINIYNKRLTFSQLPEAGRIGGAMPAGPLNRLSMLTDYILPEERAVVCPNQDVVYGTAVIGLDVSPVVIQVPDFGTRFWVYQLADLRTDSFGDLGKMYGSTPGFYLLVGPGWKGDVPQGITKVFRSSTNSGFVVPRVFQDDSVEDKKAVQAVISQIDMYPLAEFDGKMKTRDWSKTPSFPAPAGAGQAETRWVFPDKFAEQLALVLDDAPAMPGEEAFYAQMRFVLAAARKDPALKQAINDEAAKTDQDIVAPLLQFRNWGIPLPNYWTTESNGAAFGTDYFTRTAIGKSNILVNKPNETKYYYQDLDSAGARLNGRNKYTVTFTKDAMPPVRGFWSLTMYNAEHFFVPNAIRRYSVGTKNKDLKTAADGSLTIYVQASEPTDAVQRANWLPSPTGEDFSLFVRAYWPEEAIMSGKWSPPAVVRVQ